MHAGSAVCAEQCRCCTSGVRCAYALAARPWCVLDRCTSDRYFILLASVERLCAEYPTLPHEKEGRLCAEAPCPLPRGRLEPRGLTLLLSPDTDVGATDRQGRCTAGCMQGRVVHWDVQQGVLPGWYIGTPLCAESSVRARKGHLSAQSLSVRAGEARTIRRVSSSDVRERQERCAKSPPFSHESGSKTMRRVLSVLHVR